RIAATTAIPPLSGSSVWRDDHRSRTAITWNPWISACWTTSNNVSQSIARRNWSTHRVCPQQLPWLSQTARVGQGHATDTANMGLCQGEGEIMQLVLFN